MPSPHQYALAWPQTWNSIATRRWPDTYGMKPQNKRSISSLSSCCMVFYHSKDNLTQSSESGTSKWSLRICAWRSTEILHSCLLAMKGAFPSSILSCLVGWPQAHTTESTNHGPVPLKLWATANNSNKTKQNPQLSNQMSKNLFWGQIQVTMAQEHKFRLPWILCFNVVTLSWRVPCKRIKKVINQDIF